MKLTKARLQKIINTTNKQTRRKNKKNIKPFNHSNTIRNNKQFNLHHNTIKRY